MRIQTESLAVVMKAVADYRPQPAHHAGMIDFDVQYLDMKLNTPKVS